MSDKNEQQDKLDVLRKINHNPKTLRELANQLGFSLGKLNYLLNDYRKRFSKNKKFSKKPKKSNYLYILTKKVLQKKQNSLFILWKEK